MKLSITRYAHTALLALGLSLTLGACDDFLSTEPDNRLQIDTLDKVRGLLTNAYPEGSWLFVEWMTDNVGMTLDNKLFPHMVEIYTYKDVTEKSQDTPTYYWTTAYRAIAHANQALKELDTRGFDNREYVDLLRGEALICRSYAHFMLVNLFAKPYDPVTAATDPGIPYVTEVEDELLVDYQRQSVAEVYRLAEVDLLAGLALKLGTSERYYTAEKYHFNMNAALAYASRFFLFKKEYKKCIEYSDKLLGTGFNASMIKDFNKIVVGDVTRNAQNYTSYNDPSNLMLSRVEVYAHPFYSVGYRTTIEIFNQIFPESTDVRSRNFFMGNRTRTVTYSAKHDWAVKDEAFPYMITASFRGEEVFLNRLEAYLYEGRLTELKSQFNSFIALRYETPMAYDFKKHYDKYAQESGKTSEVDNILDLILIERRREFFDEGLRWFDIRRYKLLPIVHEDVTGQTHPLTEAKLVLQIPEDAIANGIAPNPR